MADTLSELLNSVGAYGAGSQAATQKILALTQSQAALASADAQVYAQVGTDNTTIAAAKTAADLQTQSARVKAANAFHTNLNSVTEQITKYAAAADTAQQVKDTALADIAAKDSITLFDDPLQYIMNQFTINGDIARHNAANAQLESANARIQSMNANTQTTVQTQNMISEPLTAATAEAATRNAAAEATLAANKASAQGISYNIAGIQAALGAQKDVLGMQFSAQSALQTERQIGISLQHLAQSKLEFANRQAEFAEKQADKAEQQQMGLSVLATINKGRAALLGANIPPLDDMSGKMVIAAMKGKGVLSTQMQEFYQAGERMNVTGVPIIGATPASAASTMQALPVALNSTQGVVKDLLSTSAGMVSGAIKNPPLPGAKNANPALQGIDPKDRTSVDRAMNAVAQQLADTFAANVKPGDSTNPYQIASINSLAANSPTVQALPVYQKVLAPLVTKGFQLTDPNIIIAKVGEAVAAGIINHKEALELSTIYHVGVKANLAMRNLPGFGIVPRLSYNTSVETNPNGFHSSEIVDLTKPDAISRAILKRQAAILSEKLSSGAAGFLNSGAVKMKVDIPMGPSGRIITDPNDPLAKTLKLQYP